MESLVVSPIVELVFEKLASSIVAAASQLGYNQELKKLQDTLLIVQAVIEDAEDRQVKDKKVRVWLSNLRDVAYDADDLLDEIRTRVRQREVLEKRYLLDDGVNYSNFNHLSKLMVNPAAKLVSITAFKLQLIPKSLKLSRKLKEIHARLDDIARQMNSFQFKELKLYSRSDTREKRETGPYACESEVYGRSEDVERIVDLLLSSEVNDIDVFSIVGIGGIGKTTVAQLAYNDERVLRHFDLRIWVCVYDNFNTKRLVSEILECVSMEKCQSSQLGILQSQFQESLTGKRYLLVLDDMWNDDQDEWDILRNLLRCGARGSKVIVTARSQRVASVMSSNPPYPLQTLTEDDCWTLFKHRAFGEEDGPPNLLLIGQQIVDKCKGVPLAAKILGGLLRFRREEAEWGRVRDSDLWKLDEGENRILSVLRLSFKHLPPHLKRCFAYCAIFPRNYHINKNRLIQQWVAGGLIQPSADKNAYIKGNEYFTDLLEMSFFQEASGSSNTMEFKIQGLIYDLAKSVAGTEFLTLENNGSERSLNQSVQKQFSCNGFARTRHVLVDCSYRHNLIPEELYGAKKLYTLNLVSLGDVSEKVFRKITTSFEHLKDLSFSGSGIKRLHKSIGKLIYLRYLDLSNTPLETLPKTIGQLCNLESLDLSGCSDLLELPTETVELTNLVHLKIEGCTRLGYLPANMGKLTSLQTLPMFPVGAGYDYGLGQLWFLRDLQGELKIKYLENATSYSDRSWGAPYECISDLFLQSLELSWGYEENDKANPGRSRLPANFDQSAYYSEVIKRLRPNNCIKRLCISGYTGTRFPWWMRLDTLFNLTELKLIHCRRCEDLPILGDLPALKSLCIQGMDYVVKLGSEFSGESTRPFPSLYELTLQDFPKLKAWEVLDSNEAFPSLRRLDIINCPLLISVPSFPVLQHLVVRNCNPLLLRSAAELSTLSTLAIESFPDLEFIPKVLVENSLLLTSLTITSCPQLPSLPVNLGKLTALRTLKLGWCELLESLPRGFTNLSSLENLEIIECPRLTALPVEFFEKLNSLKSLSIENCNGLTSLPNGMRHATALERLTIMYCMNLASLPADLHHLFALKSLTILSCPELASLPEELQHVTTLQILEVHQCSKLTELPKVEGLVSLRSLSISDCANLQSLPEDIQQLTALQHLSIRGCPDLEKRYARENGEDWQRIAEIPYVHIGPSTLRERPDAGASSSGP